MTGCGAERRPRVGRGADVPDPVDWGRVAARRGQWSPNQTLVELSGATVFEKGDALIASVNEDSPRESSGFEEVDILLNIGAMQWSQRLPIGGRTRSIPKSEVPCAARHQVSRNNAEPTIVTQTIFIGSINTCNFSSNEKSEPGGSSGCNGPPAASFSDPRRSPETALPAIGSPPPGHQNSHCWWW